MRQTLVTPGDRAELARVGGEVAALMRRARSMLFITGAGISAESGLPTYRGVGGLYERDLTEEGMPIEVALSGEMYLRRPELTWRYLTLLEAACREASPSAAHRHLAAFEQRIPRARLLTQNVDGLHLAAGSRQVIEIHGNIHRARCLTCGRRWPTSVTLSWRDPCPSCGRPLRPDVVLFGEELPRDALTTLMREAARGFDAIAIIGTTATFPYISEPVFRAAREGVPTIEINPGESEVSHFVTYRFACTAGDGLGAIGAAF